MKKRLSEITKLHRLKRNEKLLPGQIYLLSSEACAQNTYFETKRDIVRAHKLIKKHICPIMDVVDYLFTSDGWILVAEVKSEESIYAHVRGWKRKSKKIATALESKRISVIISECIRYAISGIARMVNRWNRRLGTLVRSNFDRYVFGTLEAAQEVMKKMKYEELKLSNQRKRYRPSMRNWEKAGEILTGGAVYLRVRKMVGGNDGGGLRGDLLQIVSKTDHVLRKSIKRTLDSHFTRNSQKTLQESTQKPTSKYGKLG